MAKAPVTEQDFENMSDEDFLKLDESDYSGNMPEGETDFSEAATPEEGNAHAEETPDPDETVDGNDTDDDPESDGSQPDPDPESGSEESTDGEQGSTDPMAGEGEQASPESDPEGGKQPETDSQEEGKTGSETPDGGDGTPDGDGEVKGKKNAETPAKAGYYKLPEGMDNAAVDTAVDFYKKLSVPFKADGKDFTVRSPEDAIRLMQQGVNYSRRMQEIKPMKAMNRVLQDNGLADQGKLNFAIDLMKGNKEAIAKLLKSHNIDPMDLDPEKETGYQATNYGGNAQDNAFRDALDEAITIPEGQALVNEIHGKWDAQSKAKLREDPSILGNLTEMKRSGVYDKVVAELNYQQAQGYLNGVPFLQAFDQVGLAMKNAGVFNEAPQPAANGNPMAPLATKPQGQPTGQPVASGARKQNQPPKKAAANPHLSSTPPSKQSGNQTPAGPDFNKMSDEDFLKMAPPE